MSTKRRPMPDDFREVSATMTINAMRKYYTAGEHTVAKWLAEIGGQPKPTGRGLPVPDDFAEMAAKLYPEQLKRHYGRSSNLIDRWLREAGIEPVRPGIRMPPDDWADVAPTMTRRALKDHYRADIRTINRWCEETGIQARQWMNLNPPKPRARSWRPDMSPTRSRVDYGLQITRTISVYDQAADTLRRERWAVYRCTDKGKADFKGTFWRVGNIVCTPEELLERAARAERRAA